MNQIHLPSPFLLFIPAFTSIYPFNVQKERYVQPATNHSRDYLPSATCEINSQYSFRCCALEFHSWNVFQSVSHISQPLTYSLFVFSSRFRSTK